ncbi:hypothetical protein TNIN_175631 [Trichonephila inaurata madagascariensis]|uniref:Uncharacterized protein n=1 Tax=Trichonephila inaurata madagascariensis TaxID=2747483 RepID=A0A8X6X2Q8_9ARAC|nr:hypothetical protein TNIN_175631 [Trichonephila inaurata madagascariensis]
MCCEIKGSNKCCASGGFVAEERREMYAGTGTFKGFDSFNNSTVQNSMSCDLTCVPGKCCSNKSCWCCKKKPSGGYDVVTCNGAEAIFTPAITTVLFLMASAIVSKKYFL